MIGRSSSSTLRRWFVAAFTAVLASAGVTAATATAATKTFSNPTAISIPDSGTASPYPSSITAGGFAGNVQKATVTLHSLTHTCPDDLDVLLVGPGGANSILMSDVGGCLQIDTGLITLTFDQLSANALNDQEPAVSGTYRPSAIPPIDSLVPPAPGGPYPVSLDVFNATPANGTWSLYIRDRASADMGSVTGGWSLTLNAPDNTLAAGKPKLNKKKGTAQVPVTVGDAGQLTLTGKGVKARSAGGSASAAVAGPGTVDLVVKPKGKTSRKLNSTGKATVKVNITFTPTGGAPNTQTKKIKLKKTLKK
jgi:subtilisin-like proprotein convertase family protein